MTNKLNSVIKFIGNFVTQCNKDTNPIVENSPDISIESKNTYKITSLKDSGSGTLREALESKDRIDIIQTETRGLIELSTPLNLKNKKNIIIDLESDLDIRNWGLNISNCENIQIKNCIIRMGDAGVRAKNKKEKIDRPKKSTDLDTINITNSKNITISNSSFWASCDEIISVEHSENILIKNSFFIAPLSDSALHPYGDSHAYASNNSASNVVYDSNVFAFYIMRPQFEANDAKPKQQVQMTFKNNLCYSYEKAGIRYRSGREKKSDKVKNATYSYQILGNIFFQPPNTYENSVEIECANKFPAENMIKVYIKDNIRMETISKIKKTLSKEDILPEKNKKLSSNELKQISNEKLFDQDYIIPTENTIETILSEAGTSDRFDQAVRKMIQSADYIAPQSRLADVLDLMNKYV